MEFLLLIIILLLWDISGRLNQQKQPEPTYAPSISDYSAPPKTKEEELHDAYQECQDKRNCRWLLQRRKPTDPYFPPEDFEPLVSFEEFKANLERLPPIKAIIQKVYPWAWRKT